MLQGKGMRSIKVIIIILLIAQLFACGTLIRGESRSSTYRGIDAGEQKYANLFSGDMALFEFLGYAFIGYPVDAIIDTALYPIDKTIEYSSLLAEYKKEKRFRDAHYNIELVTLNTTARPYIRYKMAGLSRWTLGSQSVGNVVKGTDRIDIPKPYALNYSVEVVWSEKSKKGSDKWYDKYFKEVTYKTNLRFPYYDEKTQFLIAIFLPCHQILMLASEEKELTRDWLNKLPFEKKYKQLMALEKQHKCPVFEMSTLDRF